MKKIGLPLLLVTLTANAYADDLPKSCQKLQQVYETFSKKQPNHWALAESGDVVEMLKELKNNWSTMDDLEKDMANLRCNSMTELFKAEAGTGIDPAAQVPRH